MNYSGGGGALLFSQINRLSKRIFFSDSSKLLINAYLVVRDDVEQLINHLSHHENSRTYFENIRAWDRDSSYQHRSDVEKASRLIYLNKTCYNGLFRVNSNGQFNVPFGDYKRPNFCDAANLRLCSVALQKVDIRVADYWEMLDEIKARDFVYLDPPYEPVSATSGFQSYTETGFNEVDQVRLFKFCQELARKRAYFLLSNSNARWIGALYRKDSRFHVGQVHAVRSINSIASGRGSVKEVTVRNYL